MTASENGLYTDSIKSLETQIRLYCQEQGLPEPELQWNPLPFSGFGQLRKTT